MLDKDAIKESLSIGDIKLVLNGLGSNEPKLDRKGNLMFNTVCHGGHSHKLYYYEDSQMFHCYTDCSENFDIYELIIKSKKQQGYELTFPLAVSFVAEKTGKRFSTRDNISKSSNLIDDWDFINKVSKKKKVNTELPVYDNTVMDLFLPNPHEDWIKEGISYKTHERFNIGYYIKDEKIVIPHYDINNNLIGIRGRAMKQEDIDNGFKYMPLKVENKLYNHPTMLNLYGLHKTKDAISRLKKVLIWEGEKSVLKCEDFYGKDNFTCATCSSNITRYHRDLLLSLGVEEVFIGYDKQYEDHDSDEAMDYAEKLINKAKLFTPFVKTYVLFDKWNLLSLKDAPCDRGRDVLEELMRHKFEIKTTEEVI